MFLNISARRPYLIQFVLPWSPIGCTSCCRSQERTKVKRLYWTSPAL